jgi:hypothetical protein
MNMQARFNKQKLIADLEKRQQEKQASHGFNRDGLSQLWPKNVNDREKKLIESAYEYGRWMEVEAITGWINNGYMGK